MRVRRTSLRRGGCAETVETDVAMTESAEPATRRSISSLGVQTFVMRAGSHVCLGLSAVLVARALGPTGRGQYYLATTIVMIAFYGANMGVEQAQFRLWARREAPADTLFTTGVLFAAGLGGAAIASASLLYALNPGGIFGALESRHLAVVLPLVPILVHSLVLTGLLIVVRDDLPRVNRAVLVGAAAQLVATGALFVGNQLTVTTGLAAYGANFVVTWVILLWRAKGIGRFRGPLPWRIAAAQLRIGAQFAPSIIFYHLNLRLDVILIGHYLDLARVGIYSIAVIVSELVWLATDALSWSIRERQSNASEDEAVTVTVRAVRMTVLFAALTGLAIAAAAPVAIPLVFGSGYSRAIPAVWLLLPAMAGMAVWKAFGQLVTRLLAPWIAPLISLVALLANLAANVVLIPRLGIAGAALGSSISYWCAALLVVGCLRRQGHLEGQRLLPGIADLAVLTGFVRSALQRQPLQALGGSATLRRDQKSRARRSHR